MTRRFQLAGFAIALLAGLALFAASDEGVAGGHEASIYDRLGAHDGVATVIDNFLANVGADARVNGRFVDTDMAALRGHLIDQVCEATGGPCTYAGKTMLDAHRGMGISEEEFGIVAQHFAAAMTEAGVDAQDHATIMSVLAGMRDDIVGR